MKTILKWRLKTYMKMRGSLHLVRITSRKRAARRSPSLGLVHVHLVQRSGGESSGVRSGILCTGKVTQLCDTEEWSRRVDRYIVMYGLRSRRAFGNVGRRKVKGFCQDGSGTLLAKGHGVGFGCRNVRYRRIENKGGKFAQGRALGTLWRCRLLLEKEKAPGAERAWFGGVHPHCTCSVSPELGIGQRGTIGDGSRGAAGSKDKRGVRRCVWSRGYFHANDRRRFKASIEYTRDTTFLSGHHVRSSQSTHRKNDQYPNRTLHKQRVCGLARLQRSHQVGPIHKHQQASLTRSSAINPSTEEVICSVVAGTSRAHPSSLLLKSHISLCQRH